MVKLTRGVVIFNREGVYHARLRRLGTEGGRIIICRSFESTDDYLRALGSELRDQYKMKSMSYMIIVYQL